MSYSSFVQVEEDVWELKGQSAGPTIMLMGGVHGNETVGVEVIENLLNTVT